MTRDWSRREFLTGDIPGYVNNIVSMIDRIGIDHVGLGSDMDGTGSEPVFNSYSRLPEIVGGLVSRGLSDAEVAQVIGGNSMSVIRTVIG